MVFGWTEQSSLHHSLVLGFSLGCWQPHPLSYLLNGCTFLKYADVEVINIYGNQRKLLPDKSDVIENKSGVRVQYIDSKWIREIIRLEGFKVRGHFRLQPVKDEDGE